jgi:hypothetical protein
MEKITFRGADGNVLTGVDYGGAGRPVLLIHGGAAHARW